jgi:hypothetical protein
MKRKTINAVITKKFNEWLESIDDKKVRKLVKENTVITGGCIASMINNEKVKDFDVYFTNRETVIAAARYYIGKFREADKQSHEIKLYTSEDFASPDSDLNKEVALNQAIPEDSEPPRDADLLDFFEMNRNAKEEGRVFIFIRSAGIASEKEIDMDDCEDPLEGEIEDAGDKTRPKYRPVFFSSNAISLSDKIQIVTRFYGTPEQIHSNFDYVHATNYWTSGEGKLALSIGAYEACHNKELIYTGSKYPVCSLFRMRKFLDRGFTITAGEILKIAMNINEFDLKDVRVLMDQLIGVDSAYFNNLICAIKDKRNIDRLYLTEILNRLYN